MSDDELPSENLTLIGRAVSLADIRKILEEQPVDAEVSLREAGEAWEQLALRSGKGSIELSALRDAGEKSPLARLRTAMTAVAKIVRGKDPKVQKKVIEQIQKAECLVAVVGTPRLKVVRGGLDVIGNLAHAMKAIVFTGEEFQDARGRPLLTLPGDDDE